MITISVTPETNLIQESFAIYRDHTMIGTICISATIEYDVPVIEYEAYVGDSEQERYISAYPSFTAAMDAIANYTEEN